MKQYSDEFNNALKKFGFHPSGEGHFHSSTGILLHYRSTVAEAKAIDPSHLDMVVAVPDDAGDIEVKDSDGIHHQIIRINDLAGFLLHRAFGSECAELRQAKARLNELTDIYHDAEQEVADAQIYYDTAQTAMGIQVIAVREMAKPRFQPVALA
ncbi:hypothetical protein [Duganella sp. HH101]|uniref:hypothetical protein n=1 Tax=Duganella sp. HH101 TaxID=1781066 RepID=UPI000873B341|nr:hypothetical protein [Duganella sp. HH101]OFA04827.1 hypothetical protein DUGA2_15700 [Duganella sp. HH101]